MTAPFVGELGATGSGLVSQMIRILFGLAITLETLMVGKRIFLSRYGSAARLRGLGPGDPTGDDGNAPGMLNRGVCTLDGVAALECERDEAGSP